MGRRKLVEHVDVLLWLAAQEQFQMHYFHLVIHQTRKGEGETEDRIIKN